MYLAGLRPTWTIAKGSVHNYRPFRKLVSYFYVAPSWPAGHKCPSYKGSFQVRWDKSIPLFLHAAIYLKYLYSIEPVRMHFPVKQPCTNDTVCNAVSAVHKWYCVQCCISRAQMILCAMLHQPCTNDIVCNAAMQHCTQYHLYMAVSRENAFWLVQRNRDTSR